MPRIFGLGLPELIIILVVVIVLFGPGRLGKILGELGSGLRSFKDGLGGDKKDEDKKDEEQKSDKDGNVEPK